MKDNGRVGLKLSGFVEKQYPHPEAPEHARLTVLVQESLLDVTEEDPRFAPLYLMLQAQNTVNSIY